MTETLALIPARGGSKGIPRKNIKSFAGYPLIAWSIAAAKQSSLVTRVIVSTDDEEIAAVAREWGAETPFLRPDELAQDKTTDLPVFEHALKWLEDVEGYRPDIVVQLRPTSPFRPQKHGGCGYQHSNGACGCRLCARGCACGAEPLQDVAFQWRRQAAGTIARSGRHS
jgi:CMP-N-acetylneuraminic acid synthetase